MRKSHRAVVSVTQRRLLAQNLFFDSISSFTFFFHLNNGRDEKLGILPNQRSSVALEYGTTVFIYTIRWVKNKVFF